MARGTSGMPDLVTGDLNKILTAKIASTKADLRRAQDVAAAEVAAMQAEIAQLEAAKAALTADRETFILQLQAVKVLQG